MVVRRVNVPKGKDSRAVKIVRLVQSAPVAHRAVSGVRVEAGNVAIGPLAVVRMVIGPAQTEEATAAHVAIVPVAAVHSRWLRKLNSKN